MKPTDELFIELCEDWHNRNQITGYYYNQIMEERMLNDKQRNKYL